MGLLTTPQITALETIQAQLKTDAASIRNVLNTLAETPENLKHNAFRAMRGTYSHMKGAILDIENTVISNSDDFGVPAG